MLLSYTIVEFHLFYDGAGDIQIWALLTRSQCKVSDTQLTVKHCGPLEKNQRFINQAHIIGEMGCVSVCNIIPFIARKEWLEKLTIVEEFFFITVICFVNRSCWNQHNTIWYIKRSTFIQRGPRVTHVITLSIM